MESVKGDSLKVRVIIAWRKTTLTNLECWLRHCSYNTNKNAVRGYYFSKLVLISIYNVASGVTAKRLWGALSVVGVSRYL